MKRFYEFSDSSIKFIKWHCKSWSCTRTDHRNSRDYHSTICSSGTKKNKKKLVIAQEEEKPDLSKVKYSVKRKSKFTNCNSKENDKKRKEMMLDNINDEKKEHLKKRITKGKKTKGDNLDGNKKEQLRNYGKIRKETICDNLDDKQKEHLKIEATKRQELA